MTEQTEELPCSDKLAFDTSREAQGAATTAEHRHGTKLKPYKCRFCQLWHLSSKYED